MAGGLEWVRRFCSAGVTADDRLLDAIVGVGGRGLAAELLARHGDVLADGSDGMVELIARWCEGPPSFETAWDTAFGLAEVGLVTGTGVRDGGVRVALRITETGFPGAWRAALPHPSTLRLGELLLTDVEHVAATSDGRVLVSGRSGEVECVPADVAGGWASARAAHIARVGTTRPIHLLDADAAPREDGGEPVLEHAQPVEKVAQCVVDRFQESLDILAGCGYLAWVEDVLRNVIVTTKDPTTHMMSGSISSLPGMIHMSYPAQPMDIAEALVHECAHQYFHLVGQVGPYVDGSDDNLYWSPPAHRHRPLDRILVAYHAMANVRLFYRAVDEAGTDTSGYTGRNRAGVDRSVAELDEPLRANPALTDLGRALYEPLAAEVAALS